MLPTHGQSLNYDVTKLFHWLDYRYGIQDHQHCPTLSFEILFFYNLFPGNEQKLLIHAYNEIQILISSQPTWKEIRDIPLYILNTFVVWTLGGVNIKGLSNIISQSNRDVKAGFLRKGGSPCLKWSLWLSSPSQHWSDSTAYITDKRTLINIMHLPDYSWLWTHFNLDRPHCLTF